MVGPLGHLPPELDSTLQSLRTVGRTLSSAKVITKPKLRVMAPVVLHPWISSLSLVLTCSGTVLQYYLRQELLDPERHSTQMRSQ